MAGLACLAFLASATQNGPTPARQAIRVCRRLLAKADLGGEANVLPSLAELEAMRGRFAEARRLVARARAAYGQLGQYALAETNCGPIEGRIELLAGDPVAAEQSFRASCEALERIGGLSYLSTRAAELGDVLYGLERYDEAERFAHRSQELGAPDDVLTQILWRSVRARVLARNGELREAEELSLEAIELVEGTDSLNRHAKVLLDRAEVLRLGGRPTGRPYWSRRSSSSSGRGTPSPRGRRARCSPSSPSPDARRARRVSVSCCTLALRPRAAAASPAYASWRSPPFEGALHDRALTAPKRRLTPR